MSSTEAELVALCDLAIELIYVMGLVTFLGYVLNGPVPVYTDNKGAYDLCHRFTSAQNSRHVDRKLFKMRELRGAGEVTVDHVPTELNPADLMTKILKRQVFERHRRTVLNCGASVCEATEGSESNGASAVAKSRGRGVCFDLPDGRVPVRVGRGARGRRRGTFV